MLGYYEMQLHRHMSNIALVRVYEGFLIIYLKWLFLF